MYVYKDWKFTLFSDLRVLKRIFITTEPSERMNSWILNLREFDYETKDKKSTGNHHANVLSRLVNASKTVANDNYDTQGFPLT